MYKVIIYYNSHESSCTQVKRWSASVIRVSVAYVNIHILRHLKEELAWAIDKRLRLIINIKQLYH